MTTLDNLFSGLNINSEILIKSAIQAGLDEIRANPWVLDFIFQYYVLDDLTNKLYGEKARQNAKKYILNNEIFVSMAMRLDNPKFPLISILPKQSAEAEAILGDIEEFPNDDVDTTSVQLPKQISLGPFTPASYNPTTGVVTVPSNLTTFELVYPGMVYFDVNSNTGYVINSVLNSSQFVINTNVNANFINSYVAPATNFLKASLEGAWYRDTYDISCFAQASSDELFFIETVLHYILLKNKQDLLEARGFERSTVQIGPVTLDQAKVGIQERIWYRSFTLTGYVKKYWIKSVTPICQGITLDKLLVANLKSPAGVLSQVESQNWKGQFDP